MFREIKVIPKDAVFTVTAEEYSDYCTLTVCKALIEIDTKVMQEEYLAEHSEQGRQPRLNTSQVIAWMTDEKQYAEEIDFLELHLGSYATADFRLSDPKD